MLVQGLTAALWSGSGRMANGCAVQDISRKGLSVLTPDAVDPETELTLVIEGAGDPMSLTCMVRYCRPANQGYRLGLLISGADRVTSAKWTQVVGDQREKRQAAA